MNTQKAWAFGLMLFLILAMPLPAAAEPNQDQDGYEVEWRITSGFGSRIHPVSGYRHFHQGVDLVPTNTRRYGAGVVSTVHGTVIYSGYLIGRGYTVIIRGESGLLHIFQHLYEQSECVELLAQVDPFDVVGGAGSTGASTGIHLHYEVWDELNEPIDPRPWLEGIYLPIREENESS